MYSFAQIFLEALIIPLRALPKEITGDLPLMFMFINLKKQKQKIHNSDYFTECKATVGLLLLLIIVVLFSLSLIPS